jgi:hypothetical protein
MEVSREYSVNLYAIVFLNIGSRTIRFTKRHDADLMTGMNQSACQRANLAANTAARLTGRIVHCDKANVHFVQSQVIKIWIRR